MQNRKLASTKLIHGLYAVTPDELDTEQLCIKVESTLKGGANLIQYRNKKADANLRKMQATALLKLCHHYNKPLIINDHVDLCLAVNADGVHLGNTDNDLIAARQLLGAQKIIGASCYHLINLAVKAQASGADYIAFGACFLSNTKPNAMHAPLSLFSEARCLGIPLVAIGGITLKNANQAIDAGADAIAVINALFTASDVKSQANQFSTLFIN